MTESVVRIYESELNCIVQETDHHRTIETGGSLYGLWTDGGNPTIFLATGPGPGAIRKVHQFEQDATAHQAIEHAMVDGFGVQAVGLWHSHHQLGLHELSGGDLNRTKQFAHRAGRTRFCDLLTYFDQSHRRANDVVTVKPYVYLDAGTGRRVPTTMVVLQGVSPVREALLADRTLFASLSAYRSALTLPSTRRARWRLERSVELGVRDDDDEAVTRPRRRLSFRRGQSTPERTEPVGSKSDETAAEDPPSQPDFAIADLAGFISDHVQPALQDVPAGVSCEVEPIAGGDLLRLTLLSASRTEQHALDIGWDGTHPLVVGHVRRSVSASRPIDLLRDVGTTVLSERIRQVLDSLDQSSRRR